MNSNQVEINMGQLCPQSWSERMRLSRLIASGALLLLGNYLTFAEITGGPPGSVCEQALNREMWLSAVTSSLGNAGSTLRVYSHFRSPEL